MRNAEVIRQWSILRDLESSRRVTIDDLAARTGVSTRTIRRDLEALQAAGFPLFDEVHDGKKFWTLEQKAFRMHRQRPRQCDARGADGHILLALAGRVPGGHAVPA